MNSELPENQTQTQASIVGQPRDQPAGPGPEIMAASTLDDDDVYNRAGAKLGSIKEIMLDVPRGRVAYAVLSSGGMLGFGDRLFAIPWGALTLDIERKCFLLDIDAEALKDAPGFNKDHWPSMADASWASSIHQYYGRPNYWE